MIDNINDIVGKAIIYNEDKLHKVSNILYNKNPIIFNKNTSEFADKIKRYVCDKIDGKSYDELKKISYKAIYDLDDDFYKNAGDKLIEAYIKKLISDKLEYIDQKITDQKEFIYSLI